MFVIAVYKTVKRRWSFELDLGQSLGRDKSIIFSSNYINNHFFVTQHALIVSYKNYNIVREVQDITRQEKCHRIGPND